MEGRRWKWGYRDEPKDNEKARAMGARGGDSFIYSLGINRDKSGSVGEVRWDSPAFDAGVGTGMSVVAVNDIAYGKEVMEDAIKAAKDDKAPIRLLVKTFDRYRTIDVDYHGGLRHPHLERIEGTPDYLTKILSPRK